MSCRYSHPSFLHWFKNKYKFFVITTYHCTLFALLNAAWFFVSCPTPNLRNWKFMVVLWCHFSLNVWTLGSVLHAWCWHATLQHVFNYFWFRYRERERICFEVHDEQHKIQRLNVVGGETFLYCAPPYLWVSFANSSDRIPLFYVYSHLIKFWGNISGYVWRI